jgi:hypothetical protein
LNANELFLIRTLLINEASRMDALLVDRHEYAMRQTWINRLHLAIAAIAKITTVYDEQAKTEVES